jgi:hypothetical protein
VLANKHSFHFLVIQEPQSIKGNRARSGSTVAKKDRASCRELYETALLRASSLLANSNEVSGGRNAARIPRVEFISMRVVAVPVATTLIVAFVGPYRRMTITLSTDKVILASKLNQFELQVKLKKSSAIPRKPPRTVRDENCELKQEIYCRQQLNFELEMEIKLVECISRTSGIGFNAG